MSEIRIRGISDIDHIEDTMYILSSEDFHAQQPFLITHGYESRCLC
jgi:hypothetical protein